MNGEAVVNEPAATVVTDLPLAVFQRTVQETSIDPYRRPPELDFEEWTARGVLERLTGSRDLTGYTKDHAAKLQRLLFDAASRAEDVPPLHGEFTVLLPSPEEGEEATAVAVAIDPEAGVAYLEDDTEVPYRSGGGVDSGPEDACEGADADPTGWGGGCGQRG